MDAQAWAGAVLADRGAALTGPFTEVRSRPWSTVRRAESTAGRVYLKENCPGTAYEAVLVPALAAYVPDRVLPALATDGDRGWLLLPDGGPTLRDLGLDLAGYAAMLTAYAETQRAVAAHAADLVALGVPDLRVERMPAHLAGFVDAADLDPALRDRLRALAPEYGRWCAELAADGVPASIQHDDLSDANVFAGLRFFDWGDACVAHPFASLLVGLNSAAYQLNAAPDSPELAYLREAYLEPWGLPPAAGRRAVGLARRVGKVGRALSWHRTLGSITAPLPAELADVADAVPGWLGELFEPERL